MLIVSIILGLMLSCAAYAAATAIAGRLAGLGVERVTLGLGPALVQRAIGNSFVQLRLLPVSSGVQFSQSENRNLSALSLLPSLLMQMAGPAAMVMVAVLLLGSDAARVARDVWMGAFGLLTSAAPDIMRGAFDTLYTATPLKAAGLVAAANAGVQMLPLPPLPGGMALARVGASLLGLRMDDARLQAALKTGAVACLTLAVWAAVVLSVALRGM